MEECNDLEDLRVIIYNHALGYIINEYDKTERLEFPNLIDPFVTNELPIEPYYEPRIPRQVHYLWLTEGLEPKPFKKGYFDNIKDNKAILDSGEFTFEQHFWMNDKAFQFTEMVQQLIELGFHIHLIDELEYINGHSN